MTNRLGLWVLSLSAGLLGATLPAVTPVAAAPAAEVSSRPSHAAQVAQAPLPAVRWTPCPATEPPGFRALRGRITCAEIMVPLDYDRPRGPKLRLNLSRVAAARPGARIGTLFVNPGGPGGPSADFAPYAARLLGKRVASRFDVVGIDPRGTGGSGGASCRGELTRPFPRVAYPRTAEQVAVQLGFDDQVRRACRRNSTALVDHVSTADNARDMELVRRALGEQQITYYGISYGTYLGATYAAMFPGRIRAMVVDGVLDPVAWSTGNASKPVTQPFSTRIASGAGSHEALTAALTACAQAGPQRCALAPDPQAAWDRVLTAAAEGRLVIEDSTISYQDLISFAAGALYSSREIPRFLRFVARIDRAIAVPGVARVDSRTAALHRRLKAVRDRRAAAGPWTPDVALARTRTASRAARTLDVQSPAVMCSDSRNPDGPRAWARAAAATQLTAPGFGPYWTWISSVCAHEGLGSPADSYRGPWTTRTSTPLLVVGNSHDPATPISGARRVHELFAGSRLLTYDGWGHGAIGTGSCVARTMADYLVDRKLPEAGRVCAAKPLFKG